MREQKSFGRRIYDVVAIISVVITALLLFFVVTNFSNLGQTVQIMTLIKSKSIQPTKMADLIVGANKGIVDSLGDPYTNYLDPELFSDLTKNIKGSYGGVGLIVTLEKDNKIVVVSPFKGTPAFKAGIHSGDWIVKINGQDTAKISLDAAAKKMQGEPNTIVTLTIFREGVEGLKDYKLTRKIIEVPSVEGRMLAQNKDIAYISLTQFSENTGAELEKTLTDLKKKQYKGIVLDLRNNPGGLLPSALEVASKFVPKGPIVHIKEKHNQQTYEAPGGNLNVPLVVLVNKGSASASEIVSGAIKDTKSGTLVGETTFGKGLVQTIYPLSNRAAIKLTTAKYLTPNKIDINKKGIEPNVKVEMSPELQKQVLYGEPNEAKDLQLQKAIEILKSKIK
jgi:carboxyl-terminal processing protease